MADINWGGVTSIAVFYLLILVVGLLASWYGRRRKARDADGGEQDADGGGVSPEELNHMLAGRNIGFVIGSFTMTATWVGGAYINGTAEGLYDPYYGLIWSQAPVCYALSPIVGGLMFAKHFRKRRYVTLADAFEDKFGSKMAGLLYIPSLVVDVMYCALILLVLGTTISVILDVDRTYSVIGSAVIAVLYTILGGLYSVAYTDVVQLICIFVGLWLAIPFVLTNDHVEPLMSTRDEWIGHWDWKYSGMWIDLTLQLVLGGIPYQAFFQRLLAARTTKTAVAMTFSGGLGACVMSIPPAIIGIAARSVSDWRDVGYDGVHPSDEGESALILPLTLQYLTPRVVGWAGLGAVSAAVMSSIDSAMLASSNMFTRNVYKAIFRHQAGNREIQIVSAVSIIAIGAASVGISLMFDSIFELLTLLSDLIYVTLFPQLLCAAYVSFSNTYGSFTAFLVSIFFRIAGGVSFGGIRIQPLIEYPYYNAIDGQLFPFRTFTMLLSLVVLVLVSLVTHFIFRRGVLSRELDIFRVFEQDSQRSGGFQLEDGQIEKNKVYLESEVPSVEKSGSFGSEPTLRSVTAQQNEE